MFENKASDQSTSPPSRGRSPNPSEISNSSRPVSKVRTSFVAVERPGENGGAPILGLRKASEASSLGGIKENAIVDSGEMEEPPIASGGTAKQDIISLPEKTAPERNAATEGGLGNILKGSAFVENTPSKPPSEPRKLGDVLTSGQAQEKIHELPSKPKDEAKAAAMVEKMNSSKSGPPLSTTLRTTQTAEPVKAPPTRQITTKSAPKSPTAAKPSPKTPTSPMASIKGGPAKIKGVMESAKQAQKAREAANQSTRKTEMPAMTQPSAPKVETDAKPKSALEPPKKERTPTSPKAVRSPNIIKPKSPPRPAKLPAAATATTASAAAKDTHHSPTEPDRKSITKKPSTLSIRQPRVSTSSTTSTLAKKTSRASLTNGHDRPKSRASVSKPDEGFLARMMRPTASSAQKVHEKVQVNSPPRKMPSNTKDKQPTKQKPPPKMQPEVLGEGGRQDQANGEHDESVLPEPRTPLPLEPVEEDSINADAERDPNSSEPAGTVEHVNGDAQEI